MSYAGVHSAKMSVSGDSSLCDYQTRKEWKVLLYVRLILVIQLHNPLSLLSPKRAAVVMVREM